MKSYLRHIYILLLLVGPCVKAQTGSYGFIENKGQIIDQNSRPNPDVLYLLPAKGMNLQLKANGFAYDTYLVERFEVQNDADLAYSNSIPEDSLIFHFNRIDIKWIGANFQNIVTSGQSADYINYYTTGTEGGVTNVHHFQKVLYEGVWPQIDVEFISTTQGPKYNFILHPGADIEQVQWQYFGADAELINENIILTTTQGEMQESIPKSFVLQGNDSLDANVNYKVIGPNHFGLINSNNLNNSTLIVDPVPKLLWSSIWGGTGIDVINDTEISGGNILFCGATTSISNIATIGASDTTYSGSYDCVVGKISKSQSKIWITYYGGIGNDRFSRIKKDGSKLYLAGSSKSNNSTLTGTSSKYQSQLGGGFDGLISQFDKNGILKWSTYYGGPDDDFINDFCIVDSALFITGKADSYSGISTTGTFKSIKGNFFLDDEGFIASLDTAGNQRFWGTYIGGDGKSDINNIENIGDSSLVIAGITYSHNNFATPGAFQTSNGHFTGIDGFAGQFSMKGQRKWISYYGDDDHNVCGLAKSDSGKILIHFNARAGYDTTINQNCSSINSQDTGYAFVIMEIEDKGFPTWKYELNAKKFDRIEGIVKVNKNLYLYGSTGFNHSLLNSYQNVIQGTQDAFVARVTNSNLTWLTYIGGNGHEFFGDLEVFNDTLLCSGQTYSSDFDTLNPLLGVFSTPLFDPFLSLFRDTCPTLSSINLSPISGTTLACPYDTFAYSVVPQMGIEYYQWNGPPGSGWNIVSGQGTPCIEVAFDTTSGPLTLLAYNSCDSLPIKSLPIIVSKIPEKPVISPNDTAYICPNDTLVLSANISQNLLWNTGDTIAQIEIYQSGSYSVKHLDTNNCFGSTSDTVYVFWQTPPDTPSLNLSGTQHLCLGDSLYLSCSPGVGYLWSTGDTTSGIWVQDSGNYSVQVRDSIFCYSFPSLSINVVLDTPGLKPIIQYSGNLNFCQGDSVLLFSNSPGNLLWSTGDTTNNIIATQSGSYWVGSLGGLGCSPTSSDTLQVTVWNKPSQPGISASGSTTICQGDSVLLSSTATQNNIWNTGDTTQQIWVKQGGAYSLVVVNTMGCSSDSSNIIAVDVDQAATKPIINVVGSTNFCDGDSVVLSSNYTTNNLWSTGDTSQSITAYQAGGYWVSYIDTSACPNPISDSVNIIVYPTPSTPIISGNTTICQGNTVVLTSNQIAGNNWSTGDTTQQIFVGALGNIKLWTIDGNGCVSDTAQVTINPSTLDAGNDTAVCQGAYITLRAHGGSNYRWNTGIFGQSLNILASNTQTFWVEDTASGCIDSILVTVEPKPNAQFTLNPSSGYTPLDVQFTNQSTAASYYTWSFGDGNSSNDQNPQHIYNNIGSFEVELIAENAFGCTDTASYQFVQIESGVLIYVPNAFSPNGDGINDYFEMSGVPEPYTFMVFDRWGGRMYNSSNYQNDWNGTYQGQTLPLGAYSYLIEYKVVHPNATQENPKGSTRQIRGTLRVVY